MATGPSGMLPGEQQYAEAMRMVLTEKAVQKKSEADRIGTLGRAWLRSVG